MVGASLYIAVCSARNRLRMRLRRLREPRYLVGAILGAAYLFFVFVLPRRAARRRGRGRGFPGGTAIGQTGLAVGSMALLLLAAASWILPASSNLLTFTEAETDLLFPAPVSRRSLVVHRLIRSQIGLLFAAMMPAFLIAGAASFSDRLLRGLALWITFATVRVYFAGVTMARAHLNAPRRRVRALAWAPLVVTLAGTLAVAVPLAAEFRTLPIGSFPVVLARINAVATAGVPGIVLWPTRVLIAPLFVEGALAYLWAITGSLVVLLTTTVWLLQSDAVFQEAGAEPVVARAPASVRRRAVPRLRGTAWPLALTGRHETLFLWKNAMQMLRELNVKSMLPLAILAVYAVVGARFGMSTNAAAAVCIAALLLAGGAVLLGPGSVMSDLRGDLGHIEVLKTWPVKASAVIRGEMLWPGLLLTGCAWVLLACATILSGAAFPRLGLEWRLALSGVAMIVAPALIFAQYAIHQAAAVMFPAWIPSDNDTRGFESMAQRLILFAGVVLALIVVVGPGAIAGGIVSFAFYRLLDSPLLFIPGAIVCLMIVAIEVILATEALGPAYERIDLSAVERRE